MNHKRYLNHYRFDPWHLPLASTDAAAGWRSPWYQNLVAHPSRDEFWDAAVEHIRHEDVSVPMLHWSGWYDVHTNGAIDGWSLVSERSRDPETRRRQHLVLGAGDHELSPEFSGAAGRTPVPGLGFTHDRVRRFMDHYLKGEDNGVADEPRVHYYLTGADEWRTADTWPPASASPQELFLQSGGSAATDLSDGRLSPSAPGALAADHYRYDPSDPAAHWLDRNIWEMAGVMGDRLPLEGRPDVVVYTGEESATGLDLGGPVAVTLFAASSARDTDFTAALVDVFPDGFAQLIREGIVRARYRESERAPTLIEPGQVYEYTIDLGSVAYRVPAGHRLRLEISSSSFDRWDRNLYVGGVSGKERNSVVADQTILHDAAHPSRVRLTLLASSFDDGQPARSSTAGA
jgi:putative CocE/NonD family hydrolase